MAQTAIIHTTTRVIRRLTIDPSPVLAADETAIALATDIDLSGGFWKLDAQNDKVAATSDDVSQAGVDDAVVYQQQIGKLLALRDAALAVVNDTSITNENIKAFATHFLAL